MVLALGMLCWMAWARVEAATSPPSQQQIPLAAYFNNDAFSHAPLPHGALPGFDGAGNTYPAGDLPAPGRLALDGVAYQFPGSGTNNVVALGQTIRVPDDHYAAAYWLASASYGPAGGRATLNYADGTRSTSPLVAPDWVFNEHIDGVLTTGGQSSPARMYTVALPIDPQRVLESITLPTTALPTPARKPGLHIFALTLQPVAAAPAPAILDAYCANQPAADGTHTIVVTIQNLGREWITPPKPITVSVGGPGLHTTTPGSVTLLGPLQQVQVEVQVALTGDAPTAANSKLSAQVTARTAEVVHHQRPFSIDASLADYLPTSSSIQRHRSPRWFDNAKFGIFIHWGPYSVPAWAPVGTAYAEWYWYWLHQHGSPVFAHHQQTYGTDVSYDDFLPEFTAGSFDPLEWIQLIQQSGARYFVFTAKHHDGVALFDDQANQRNTVALEPHRDLVGELFDAAQLAAPALKRGVYYSLPEWYNPDYPKRFDRFGNGAPRNAYSGEPAAYTGYTRVADYVRDYQTPQLIQLVTQYDPDILWCDIGGPNDSLNVLASYFNQARSNHKHVAVNDRCGIDEHDFSTSEYSTRTVHKKEKWEENRGIDPYSYGYNAATSDSAYVSAEAIVHELVDVTSKNGNLLLGIGPRADGTIPEVVADRLRDVGAWLTVNGEAIYDTTPWMGAQQEHTDGHDVRFTVASNRAFYAIDLRPPGRQEVIRSPVPLRTGDTITLLGYTGGPLAWSRRDGNLVIEVPPEAVASGQHAWTFKIDWQR